MSSMATWRCSSATAAAPLGPGDHVVVPGGTIHTFATVGDQTARVMVVMTAHIDALVQALHSPLSSDWAEVWERHDSEMVRLDADERPI